MGISHIPFKEMKHDNFGEQEDVRVVHAHDPGQDTGCSDVSSASGAISRHAGTKPWL